jgi:N-acetylglutamate synthase
MLIAMPVTIAELEAVAALGWRAPEEAPMGGWLLRAAEGFTGRANSALAVGDPGLPLADALGGVCGWYAARGLPPMIAVPHPLGRPRDSHVDRFLDQRGWGVRSGPAVVMTAATADIASGGPAADAELRPEPDQAWLSLYHYRGRKLPPIARRLLLSAPFQAFASIRRNGGTVAIGRVAVAAGWGGLTAVEVHPGYRRSGLATAITAALAGAAASRGAAYLYLQVEEGNTAARDSPATIGTTTGSPRPCLPG